MSKRCKHQNGELIEHMTATHAREVTDGNLEPIGFNEIDDVTGYEYHCFDCDKYFKFVSRPRQHWLRDIHDQLRDA